MAEESSGVGHTLLGANPLQASVDKLDKTVNKLDDAADKMSTAASRLTGGSTGGGSTGLWNAASNYLVGRTTGNGGNPTFGGQSAGAHRADGPAQTPAWAQGAGNFARTMAAGNGGTVGGSYQAAGGGVSGATAAGAVGIMKVGGFLANNGQDSQSMYNNLMLAGTATQMYTQGVAFSRSMAGVYGSADAGDFYQGRYALNANSGYLQNSSKYGFLQTTAGGMGYLNPTTSFTQNANALMSGRSNQTVNSLKAFGINTYMRSPSDVANQLMAKLGINTHGKKYTPAQIQMLTRDPNMGLGATLQGFVSSGAMSQDFASSIQDAAYANLVGQSNGYSSSQMQNLLNQAGSPGGGDAAKALQKMGIGTTTEQKARDKNAATTQSVDAQLGGFTASLKTTTDAMDGLNKVIRSIPGVSALAGANTGSGGLLSKAFGIGAPLLGAVMPGIGSALSGLLKVGGEGDSGVGATFSSAGFAGYGGFSEAGAVAAALAGLGGGSPSGSSSSSTGSSTSSTGASPTGGSGGNWGGSTGNAGTTTGGPVSGTTGGTSSQQAIVNEAKKYIGVKYVWGGSTPKGFDCSGLACWVLNKAGFSVGRTTAAGLSTKGRPVRGGLSAAQPGDLVFFGTGSISHVGIYVGGGKMIDAPHTGSSVRYDNVAGFNPPFRFVRRFAAGSSTPVHAGTNSIGGNNQQLTNSVNQTLNQDPYVTGHQGGGSGGGGGDPRSVGRSMAASFGWTGNQWSALDKLWTRESGWRVNADNPTSSAYGIPQALLSAHSVPRGYYDRISGHGAGIQGYGGNARVQIQWGLNYIRGRYGSPANAWQHETTQGWYDKGAWELKQDETARVHKGEMIIPKNPADQIRQVLLQNNTTGAGRGKSGSGSAQIVFQEGSIVIRIDGGSGGITAATGRGLGNELAQAIAQDARIKALLSGGN